MPRGDSIMNMEDVEYREDIMESAELGLKHLQSSFGKQEISITDAVNSFMTQEDKASCTHIFVFTIILMKTNADEFDSITAPGVMGQWIDTLKKRYEELPDYSDKS